MAPVIMRNLWHRSVSLYVSLRQASHDVYGGSEPDAGEIKNYVPQYFTPKVPEMLEPKRLGNDNTIYVYSYFRAPNGLSEHSGKNLL